MGGNHSGGGSCRGHSRRAHMSAYDGMPRLLRRALAEAWEDWCAVSVLEQFNEYRARPMDIAAAARATALHLARQEEAEALARLPEAA